MSGIGHNNGPDFAAGVSWRKHCWKKARADLLPHLPIEVLRGRVRRAGELGLDYTTYASVRASTGRDVIGFLFSSNALRAFVKQKTMPEDRLEKLHGLERCARIALVSAPLRRAEFLDANPGAPLAAAEAPQAFANWPDSRARVLQALAPDRLPADGVLLVGDTTAEREWSEAGRLAGYLSAERYFVPTPA